MTSIRLRKLTNIIYFVILLYSVFVMMGLFLVVHISLRSEGEYKPSRLSREDISSFNKSKKNLYILSMSDVKFDFVESAKINNRGEIKTLIQVDFQIHREDLNDVLYDQTEINNRLFRNVPLILENQNVCKPPSEHLETDISPHKNDSYKDSKYYDWIIYIHSSCVNHDRRRIIRNTWANKDLFKKHKFVIVFLLGSPKDVSLQLEIKKEFIKYGDILQGHFIDSYRNLTYKAVMGLQWISKYCPDIPYVIKADDDSFLNIFEIKNYFKSLDSESNTIICPFYDEDTMPILRNRKTCMKWCVRQQDLPGMKYFPSYCGGILYLLTMSLVKKLALITNDVSFFWIDDVYITGLLPKHLYGENVTYINIGEHMSLKVSQTLADYKSDKPIRHHVVHSNSIKTFINLWVALIRRLTPEQESDLNERTFDLLHKTLFD